MRYAPNSEKTIWRSLQEYAEPTKSFIDFKHAVIAEYISDDGQVWSTLRDLEILVTTTAQNGVHSLKEFGEYSRKFRNIAMQLVSGRYLREDERDYCFLQGLQASLRVQVVDRLQVTHPEVLAPRQQYSIAQVSEAVRHILDAAIPVPFAHRRFVSPSSPPLHSLCPTLTASPTSLPVTSELTSVAETLRAMTDAFSQLQRTQQVAEPQQSLASRPSAAQQAPPPLSDVSNTAAAPQFFVSAATRPTSPSLRPTLPHAMTDASAPSSKPDEDFDIEQRIDSMRRELYALERQRAQWIEATRAPPEQPSASASVPASRQRQPGPSAPQAAPSRELELPKTSTTFSTSSPPPIAITQTKNVFLVEEGSQSSRYAQSLPYSAHPRLQIPTVAVRLSPPVATRTSSASSTAAPASLPHLTPQLTAAPARPYSDPRIPRPHPLVDKLQCVPSPPAHCESQEDESSLRRAATSLLSVHAQDTATVKPPQPSSDDADVHSEVFSNAPLPVFLAQPAASCVDVAESPPDDARTASISTDLLRPPPSVADLETPQDIHDAPPHDEPSTFLAIDPSILSPLVRFQRQTTVSWVPRQSSRVDDHARPPLISEERASSPVEARNLVASPSLNLELVQPPSSVAFPSGSRTQSHHTPSPIPSRSFTASGSHKSSEMPFNRDVSDHLNTNNSESMMRTSSGSVSLPSDAERAADTSTSRMFFILPITILLFAAVAHAWSLVARRSLYPLLHAVRRSNRRLHARSWDRGRSRFKLGGDDEQRAPLRVYRHVRRVFRPPDSRSSSRTFCTSSVTIRSHSRCVPMARPSNPASAPSLALCLSLSLLLPLPLLAHIPVAHSAYLDYIPFSFYVRYSSYASRTPFPFP